MYIFEIEIDSKVHYVTHDQLIRLKNEQIFFTTDNAFIVWTDEGLDGFIEAYKQNREGKDESI